MAHDTEITRFSHEDAAALTRIESARKPGAEWVNRPDPIADEQSVRRFAKAIAGIAVVGFVTAMAVLDHALPQPGGDKLGAAPATLVGTDTQLGVPMTGFLPAAGATVPTTAPARPTGYLPDEIPLQAPEAPAEPAPTF